MLISKADIDEVKARHELVAFIASTGVELKKKGAYYVGRCPFHSPDKTPSLIVDPRKQLFNCLGACSANGNAGGGKGRSGGDLLAFAMKFWNVDFREAYRRLGGKVTDELPPPRRRVRTAVPAVPAVPARVEPGPVSRAALISRVVDRMHEELSVDRRAQEMLESRGLRTRAHWRVFKLGFSSGAIEDLAGTEAAEARKLLIESGILNDEGRERMKGRVVFPLFAFNQLAVGLYGRAIDEKNEPHHLFLPGPRRGLFNWNAARRSKEILLVESVIDAFSLIESGVTNAIPLYGVNGLTEDHRELVKRFEVTSVVVALDADETGRKASPFVAGVFESLGLKARVIEWPEKDPNELLVKHGASKLREITEKLLNKPRPAELPAIEETRPAPEAAPASLVSQAANALPLTASASANAEASEKAVKEEKPERQPAEISSNPDELTFTCGDRLYHVRGVAGAAKGGASLRVRIKLTREGASDRAIDSIDLFSLRSRSAFLAHAASLNLGERNDLERELLRLVELIEQAQETHRAEAPRPPSLAMKEGDRKEAFALLFSPDLLDQAAYDMTKLGYVGETTNKKIGLLVSISRKLDAPLSMIVMSQSGSGKSALAEVLEQLTPAEDVILFSRLTPQALFYMERNALQRRFILIEERAGSFEADYSIRILQSKKRLVLALPIKDPATGKTQTQVFEILGPAAFLETTTESRLNPENASRCFEIFCDESEEQTKRIHEAQKRAKTAEGRALLAEREAILRRHQNAQRLLESVRVEIPYAPLLRFPSAWLRTRRDHLRFLNLIEAIAFLYQHQRVKRTDENGIAYIEATVEDYERAYELASEVLGQTLSDAKRSALEFYEKVRALAERVAAASHKRAEDVVLTRRELREATGLPDHRLRALLLELCDLEYLEIVAGNQGRTYRYRLASPAPAAPPRVLLGLLTPEELRARLRENER